MTITDNVIDTEVEAPIIPDAIAAQARELDDMRAAIKALKDREETLRASLLDFLTVEGLESVSDGTVSINVATHKRAGIDKARMEALYPKVLADCATETSVTQLRVKIKG